MAPAPSTVVAIASSTWGRAMTASSLRTWGTLPRSPLGSAYHRAAMASRPSTAVPAKAMRQPTCWPTQVAAGTPPILAMVRPINIVATALACLSLGTTLAATTAPRPKKAPWLRLVTSRDASKV
ncbi:hypothetical protein D3C73_1421300 [compost metagenome]